MSDQNKSNRYVLVFEDDIDLALQWVKVFKDQGMVVEHATTVDEAIIYCKQKEFDAVVLDIFVLDSDGNFVPRAGFTLLSYLRSRALGKIPEWGLKVPVLAVTGAKSVMGYDALIYAESMGATSTLRKPFKPDVLYSKILELIENPTT